MFSLTPILLVILLAFKPETATARPSQRLDTAAVSPASDQVVKRFQINNMVVTVVNKDDKPKLRRRDGEGQDSKDTSPTQNTNATQNTNSSQSANSTQDTTDTTSTQTSMFQNYTGRVVDLTPAHHTGGICYPGAFQVPAVEDCQVLVNAQLYNSTGSLAAYPGTIVYVSYQTCAAVVQNLDSEAPQVQYNWAMLGKTTKTLFNTCLSGGSNNMGGALFFEKYLDLKFKALYITLQRFDDSHLPPPQPLTEGPKPIGSQ